MSLLAFIPASGLRLLNYGHEAPLWHFLVTIDNSIALNLICAFLASLSLAMIVWRLVFWEDWEPGVFWGESRWRKRWTPLLVLVSFFAVPQFVFHLLGLSPFMLQLALVLLSMLVSSMWCHSRPLSQAELDDDEVRHFSAADCWNILRFVIAGAFAALAAWEGTMGLICAPLLLVLAEIPIVRRGRNFSLVLNAWGVGFLVAFAIEAVCFGFPWLALSIRIPPLLGLGILFVLTIVPVGVARRYGENIHLRVFWCLLLLPFVILTALSPDFRFESGCQRFAKALIRELGERKLIVGDGIFDDFLKLYKPDDVRVVNPNTIDGREFLINYFDKGEVITNRALLVRQYYSLPEMDEAAAELGLVRRNSDKTAGRGARNAARKRAVAKNEPVDQVAVYSNAIVTLSNETEPVFRVLKLIEEEFDDLPEAQKVPALREAQLVIRRAWRNGVLRGSRLSNALLLADMKLGDGASMEADSLSALMIDRDDPTANGILGAVRFDQGKIEAAERYLRKGVKGGGVFPIAKLGVLLVETERYDEAIALMRPALVKHPNERCLREPLAAALLESGQYDAAEHELDEIARIVRSNGNEAEKDPFLVSVRQVLKKKKTPLSSATDL